MIQTNTNLIGKSIQKKPRPHIFLSFMQDAAPAEQEEKSLLCAMQFGEQFFTFSYPCLSHTLERLVTSVACSVGRDLVAIFANNPPNYKITNGSLPDGKGSNYSGPCQISQQQMTPLSTEIFGLFAENLKNFLKKSTSQTA